MEDENEKTNDVSAKQELINLQICLGEAKHIDSQQRSNSSSEQEQLNSLHQNATFENQSEFDFNDQELHMLIKRPVLVDGRSIAQFKNANPYCRPQQCPKCDSYVLRDSSVVDNKVKCPNLSCQISFCWLCLEIAREKPIDHFDELNFFQCPDL